MNITLLNDKTMLDDIKKIEQLAQTLSSLNHIQYIQHHGEYTICIKSGFNDGQLVWRWYVNNSDTTLIEKTCLITEKTFDQILREAYCRIYTSLEEKEQKLAIARESLSKIS